MRFTGTVARAWPSDGDRGPGRRSRSRAATDVGDHVTGTATLTLPLA